MFRFVDVSFDVNLPAVGQIRHFENMFTTSGKQPLLVFPEMDLLHETPRSQKSDHDFIRCQGLRVGQLK